MRTRTNKAVFAVVAMAVALTATVVGPANGLLLGDLGVSGQSRPEIVGVGGKVVQEITVRNEGVGPATLSSVSVSLPAGATFLPGASDACWSGSGESRRCSLGLLMPANDERTLLFSFAAPTSPGTFTNTATVSSLGELSLANNTTTMSTTVVATHPTGPDATAAFMTDGDSLTLTTANGRHTFSVPEGADAALLVTLEQTGSGDFCDGPCTSPSVTLDFPLQVHAIDDVNKPGRLELVFTGLPACHGIGNDCRALYWVDPSGDPDKPAGGRVPWCAGASPTGVGYGIAYPDRPCINEQSNVPSGRRLVILQLSTDPTYGLR